MAQIVIGVGSSANDHTGDTLRVAMQACNANFTELYLRREALAADRTYYVRTDGSNSNTGLVDSSGGAFLTVQKALDITAALDLRTFNITVQVKDGTYTGAAMINGPWLGSGTVTIQGNASTPANVVLNISGNAAVTAQNNGAIILKDMKLVNSGAYLLSTLTGGFITFSNMNFGSCASQQLRAETGGRIMTSGSYTISGGANFHMVGTTLGSMVIRAVTITLTGTPAFLAFAYAELSSGFQMDSLVFSGTATGQRYAVTANGCIFTVGGGATYLPGNAAGDATNGGQYS